MYSELAEMFSDENTNKISKEQFFYSLIFEKGVDDTFPNVEIALRIYLVLMISNCTGERSFSKLKIIENRLRTSSRQDRLSDLAMMSIENDILREINFQETISDFAMRKSRKGIVQ